MSTFSLVLMGIAGWRGSPAHAGLQASQVPTFQLRAHIVSVGGVAPSGKTFTFNYGDPSLGSESAPVSVADSAWSPWLPFDQTQVQKTLAVIPNAEASGFPFVLRLRVGGVVDPTLVEAELRLDETGQVVPLSGELFGPLLGVVLWRDASNAPYAATMADYNQQHYWSAFESAQLPVAQRPKLFPIVDRFIGGDDDRRDWRDGIQHLALNGCTAMLLPPSAPLRDLLLQAGLRRTAWRVYNPPGVVSDYDPQVTPQSILQWAQQQARPYLDAGYSAQDMALFSIADEPGWYYPAMFSPLTNNPAALTRFQDYLKAQNLQPTDLGASSWDQVLPKGRSQALDLPSRRLFYWTMRFFAWDSSRHYANCTRALESAFYPNLPVFANFNNFSGRFYNPGPVANSTDRGNPDASMGVHDWFEFAKMRGTTMLWTEDWFEDSRVNEWSFYASKFRCAARKSGGTFGGYVVPRGGGQRAEGIQQKILCLIGSGAKALWEYEFGPDYNFPGNCYSEKLTVVPKIAEAHKMIAAAEDLLWPGQRPPAQVAILVPRSSEAWDDKDIAIPVPPKVVCDVAQPALEWNTVDYMSEVYHMYLALSHANIPVDFVDEDDLSLQGLKPYQVLYITEPNIPSEGQRGIAAWVRNGGTLVTVPGAGTRDRYDEPTSVLKDLTGTAESPYNPLVMLNLSSLVQIGDGQGSLGNFRAYGGGPDAITTADQRLNPVLMPAVLQDGSAGIVSHRVRRGRVIRFSFMPGMSYAYYAQITCITKDTMQEGYPDSLRQWITYPTQVAKVVPPVTVDHPLVETPLLLSSGGAAMTVLNWTGEALPSVGLTVRVPFAVRSVVSVKQGPIPFQQTPDGVVCSLPLDAADIVMLRP